MKDKIVIVGIGETADLAFEYFTHDQVVDVVAFSVSNEFVNSDQHNSLPLVALEQLKETYPPADFKVFVALSSGKLNRNRAKLFNAVKEMGYQCVSYISPKAFVWRTAQIGENCFIFENNVIQHGVEIGDNVVIWSGNHIGHQTKISDHVFITSHCVISGFCSIGQYSFLGVNSCYADNISVGKDCFVGMGATVNKSLKDDSLVKPPQFEVSNISARRFCKVPK